MIIKRTGQLLGTIIPIYAMLTIFMPLGFGGVPCTGIVLFAFATLFLTLLIIEHSPLWNGLTAFLFWMPMIAIHLMQPGTETVANGKVHEGVIAILGIGLLHGAVQFVARWLINAVKGSKTHRDGPPHH